MKGYVCLCLLLGLVTLKSLPIAAVHDYFFEEEGSGEDPDPSNPWVGECPAVDRATSTLLQHVSDCNKYFVCEHGSPTLMSCPAGLHFNIVLSVCDWPDAAECEVSEYFLV